jgi:hypothetical protein
MASPLLKPRLELAQLPVGPISPQESASYTSDLLGNLSKMASAQGQDLLVHLLELARFEAQSLAKGGPR